MVIAKNDHAHQELARQFIVGENTKEAIKNMERLRKDGVAFVVDVLGLNT